MNVLLVDDSPAMRRYVARTLQMAGFEAVIHEAANGLEGVSMALSIRPDLVITDLNMPEMNGAELVSRMRESPELREIPVLVLTADRSPARPGDLIRAGAVGYLTKPITPRTLRDELRSILGGTQ